MSKSLCTIQQMMSSSVSTKRKNLLYLVVRVGNPLKEGLLREFYEPLDCRIVVEDLQWGVNKLYEIGFIKEKLDVSKYVDNSYLPP